MIRRPGSGKKNSCIVHVENKMIVAEGYLIPVCAWCNKVRDKNGQWHQIDFSHIYHAGFGATHTICTDCKKEYAKELQPEITSVPQPGLSPI